jgi:hypothetical protein
VAVSQFKIPDSAIRKMDQKRIPARVFSASREEIQQYRAARAGSRN